MDEKNNSNLLKWIEAVRRQITYKYKINWRRFNDKTEI